MVQPLLQYICNIAAIELQYPGAVCSQQTHLILSEKTQMKTQRIVSLDLIRMAAILLVITQHAWSGLPTVLVGFQTLGWEYDFWLQ